MSDTYCTSHQFPYIGHIVSLSVNSSMSDVLQTCQKATEVFVVEARMATVKGVHKQVFENPFFIE